MVAHAPNMHPSLHAACLTVALWRCALDRMVNMKLETYKLWLCLLFTQAVSQIQWEDAYYRKDIAWRAIARLREEKQ